MAIDKKDIMQQFVGVIVATIWIFVLRDTPLFIDPQLGLGLGIIWLFFLYQPSKRKTTDQNRHFILSVAMALIVTTFLTFQFNFATTEQLMSFDFFGTLAWSSAIFFGVTGAIAFDKNNVDSPLNRFFIRRRT